MKKPSFEKIKPSEGSFFSLHHHKDHCLCHLDWWHFHPEFEIVYVPHGKGRRFVGHQAGMFTDGLLVLLGSNVQHYAFNFGFESEGYEEYVIQFRGGEIRGLADPFPEFGRVGSILDRARTGLGFEGVSKHRIGGMIREMMGMNSFQRLLRLFEVLREMSLSKEVEELGARTLLSVDPLHLRRIEQVYRIIQKDYQNELTTRRVADELAMTDSSFCRFFKATTGKTFKEALTEARIQKACELLVNSDMPVGTVASLVGFNNISLFNRLFRSVVKTAPNKYRGANRVSVET